MNKEMDSKVILITGASAGMGKATAKQLINEGHIVYGAARRLNKMDDLVSLGGHALEMDVTNDAQTTAAIDKIFSEQGRIDVLINNAGYSVAGAVEDVSEEDARQQMDVNLFGSAFLVKKIIPHMRERQSGHIINVTSVGARTHLPINAWYHASKYALNGWSNSLRVELQQFGINVTIVEPGAIETEFSDVAHVPLLERSKGGHYENMVQAYLSGVSNLLTGSPSNQPEVIAQTISKAVNSKKPKIRYISGKFAKMSIFLRTILSDRMFDRMVMSMMK